MTIKRKQEKCGQDHTQNAIIASYSDFKRQLVLNVPPKQQTRLKRTTMRNNDMY